jgi:hypothetical protein
LANHHVRLKFNFRHIANIPVINYLPALTLDKIERFGVPSIE